MPNWCGNQLIVSGEKHLVKQFEDDAARKSEGDNVFTLAAFHPCPEELVTAEEGSTSSIGYDVFFAPDAPVTLPENPTPAELLDFAVASGRLRPGETPAERVLEFPWVQEAGVTTVEELKAFLRKKDPKYEAVSYTHLTLPTILRV